MYPHPSTLLGLGESDRCGEGLRAEGRDSEGHLPPSPGIPLSLQALLPLCHLGPSSRGETLGGGPVRHTHTGAEGAWWEASWEPVWTLLQGGGGKLPRGSQADQGGGRWRERVSFL